MISVLMAIYDEPVEIYCRALSSIGNQTVLPKQVVLVNDNPARKLDGEAISLALGCPSIHVDIIDNEKNLGLAESLNRGLKKCSQQFIARMDADDESDAKRFERQANFMRAQPGTDMVFCNTEDSSREGTNFDCGADEYFTFEQHFFTRFPFRHATMFVKSDIYKKLGYRKAKRSQDWELYFRAKKHGVEMEYIPDKLYVVHKYDKYEFNNKIDHLRRQSIGHIYQFWLLTKNIGMLHKWNGFSREYKLRLSRLPKVMGVYFYATYKIYIQKLIRCL